VLTKIEDGVTAESVEKELTHLENYYKARRRKLRALLGVLKEEAGPAETKKEESNVG